MGGPGYCWDDTWWAGDVPEEQRAEMDRLDRRYFKDTSKLRNELWTKSDELGLLLRSPNPNSKEVRALQNDISDLKGKLAEKRTDFELEARKVIPERGYSRGHGRGYGRHMMGMSGSGHRGGYGMGGCW
jgi:zinc resistance-associated protein